MHRAFQTRRLLAASAALAVGAAALPAAGQAVDFSTFTTATSVPSSFDPPQWETPTEYNGFSVNLGDVARETVNADTTLFHGPSSLDLTNTVITGDFYGASDDDYMGIALGVPTATSPFLDFGADYLLMQWKGGTQNFDWTDEGDVDGNVDNPFNNTTVGGVAPVGLSLNRVSGVPTADEFWQGQDLTMFDPQGKTAPDPLTDPLLTDDSGNPSDSGGVQELARANTLGDQSYNRFGERTRFEITYTPENVTVLVDGVEEFNVDAPQDNPFPSGTLGLYEQAMNPSEAFAFFDVRPIGDEPATPGQDLSPPAPVATFAAANITAGRDEDGAHDNSWDVEAASVDGEGNKLVEHASPDNKADATFSFGGQPVEDMRRSAVMMATVRQNGPVVDNPNATEGGRSAYPGVEANSGFGGDDASGISTYGHDTGGEHNTDVAIAMFPYADGFRGGHVASNGSLLISNNNASYTATRIEAPLPSVVAFENDLDGEPSSDLFFAGNQQQVTNLAISGENSQQDGLLFTVGSSPEDNWTAATPLADGSWNVAVRDADSVYYAGPDTFEADDFSFLYVEEGDVENSIGGRVTGIDESGDLSFAQTWGDFSMTRNGVGDFSLSLPGVDLVGEEGMLLLNSTDEVTLSDGTVAPDNRWLTYEANGDDLNINLLDFALSGDLTFEDVDTDEDGIVDTREFTDTQTLTPTLVDGGFSFAFIPFNPSDFDVLLDGDANDDGVVNGLDVDALAQNFGNPGDRSTGDFNGDGVVDGLDVDVLAQNFGTGEEAGIAGITAVPEPTSLALLGLGGLILARRRRSA